VGVDMAVRRVLCVSEAVDGTADGGAQGGVTSSAAAAAGAIVLQPGFAVFATVHATESEALALSPATRSRFTEIWCPAYDKEDMMQVRVAGVWRGGLALFDATEWGWLMEGWRSLVANKDPNWRHWEDILLHLGAPRQLCSGGPAIGVGPVCSWCAQRFVACRIDCGDGLAAGAPRSAS
jgi:hypothetical protein